MTKVAFLRFDHLLRLSDAIGVREHTSYSTQHRPNGYNIDDNAEALVVATLSNDRTLDRLARATLSLISGSLDIHGRVRNRLSTYGVWDSTATAGDPLGRAWQGVGAAFRHGPLSLAEAAFEIANRLDYVDPEPLRPSAFAALGASDLLASDPAIRPAQVMADRARRRLLYSPARWGPWPEPRLTYANARVPEAMMALGHALCDDALTSRGLMLLEWLANVEWHGGHWSFTPVGGRGPNDARPAFDQRPIEAAAMADASFVAWQLTGDNRWAGAVLDTGFWLMGVNDARISLYDRSTGACRDGLGPTSVNNSQGAASTLSGLLVLLRCRDVAMGGRRARGSERVDIGSANYSIDGSDTRKTVQPENTVVIARSER